ncbi:MAG: lipoyl(octanoyl) transferase LipB [Proteobacteria bacterium]|nr:lipoyl(octanoyl) transferase LipB [Pseudomonadota bacterium]
MAVNASKKGADNMARLAPPRVMGLGDAIKHQAKPCHIHSIAGDAGDAIGAGAIDWWHSGETAIPYDDAVALMEAQAHAIRAGSAREAIWLLEHQPVYTGGRSSQPKDLHLATTATTNPTPAMHAGIPIRHSNRGGQWTYHAPGQRVVYIMLDVLRYGGDVRAFVRGIETWGIATLAQFGIKGVRRPGLPGIWVENQARGTMDKIIAIGIRLTRWVSWHGMAINVRPEVLAGFAGIVPCGVRDGGVTCLGDLMADSDKESGGEGDNSLLMQQLDTALMASFAESLGRLARP